MIVVGIQARRQEMSEVPAYEVCVCWGLDQGRGPQRLFYLHTESAQAGECGGVPCWSLKLERGIYWPGCSLYAGGIVF